MDRVVCDFDFSQSTLRTEKTNRISNISIRCPCAEVAAFGPFSMKLLSE